MSTSTISRGTSPTIIKALLSTLCDERNMDRDRRLWQKRSRLSMQHFLDIYRELECCHTKSSKWHKASYEIQCPQYDRIIFYQSFTFTFLFTFNMNNVQLIPTTIIPSSMSSRIEIMLSTLCDPCVMVTHANNSCLIIPRARFTNRDWLNCHRD